MSWKTITGLALMAAALTVFTVLANGPRRTASTDPQIDWKAVEAAYDPNEILTVSWMGPPYSVNATEGGWLQTYLERRYHLKIKPIFLGGPDYEWKKPMMSAGGVFVPDVAWEADPINVQMDARNGFIIPIPYELILKHAPSYVRLINETAPQAWMYSYYRRGGEAVGRNLGVPTIWSDGVYPESPAWRKDWLEKVGIKKVPATLEEMHEALRRFRYQDPDGNGVQDTYGMTANSEWWFRYFDDIFAAFGAPGDKQGLLPFDWIERDGKIVYGGVVPEARAALELLAAWYKEGLIHPDFQLDRGEDNDRKFLNGKVGYLSHGGVWWAVDPELDRSMAKDLAANNPRAAMVMGPPPQGPNGHRGIRIWGGGGNTMVFGAGVAKKPQLVIRMLKMWDEMAAACFDKNPDETNVMLVSKCGQRGLHYEYRDGKSPGSGLKTTPEYADSNKRSAATVGLGLAGGTFFSPCGASVELTAAFRSREEVAFNDTYRKRQWGAADVFLKPDVVPSAAKYLKKLREKQMSVYTQIIKGDLPIAAFDEFANEWYRRGGRQMTDEANALFQDMNRVYGIVGARP
ncbi:MAG: extracellular solute-binding protein [Planctomycetaceae bacterium]|nr:extracellular solute-binding protein [Planctomycetaceae bacterium]